MSLRRWIVALVLLPLFLIAFQTAGLLLLAATTQRYEADANRALLLYAGVAQLESQLSQTRIEELRYRQTGDRQHAIAAMESRQALDDEFALLDAEAVDEPLLNIQIPEIRRLALMSVAAPDSQNGFAIAQKRFADIAYNLRAQRILRLTELWRITIAVLAATALAGIGLALGLSLLARRFLAQRIERIVQHAAAYAKGDELVETSLVDGNDDIARLDQALHDMARTIADREAKLRVALSDAEAASNAKSTFVATMSHEIRTPLNGILGMIDLLLESPLADREREYAETIRTSSTLLLNIINDILNFSRMSVQDPELEITEFEIEPLVRSVLAVFSAQAKKIDLRLTMDPGLTQGVFGDELRLRQILLNLIGNAVKFTDSGSVHVRVTKEFSSGDGLLVRFAVSDTGVGISKSDIDTIFEPFRQADMSATRRFGGTGLGLSIVRQLVTAMNGEVGVDSVVSKGSTFWFTIPFQYRSYAIPLAVPAAPEAAITATLADEPSLRHERVLVAEDNDINQKVALRMLGRFGLSADLASNGEEAVEAAGRADYDLILMDIQMPKMNGLDATVELRRRQAPGKRRVPIIAMTANAFTEDRDACLINGMDDFLAKPVTLVDLRRVLQRWLPVVEQR
jgi:signal transduction histidine kinase/ActR/RegA family two-component response regulator